MRRWLVAIALACGLLGAGSAAGAEPAVRVALEWQRGPRAQGCADADALRQAAAAHVRQNALVDAREVEPEVIIRGRSERRAAAWHATIGVIDRAGRELGRRELTRTGDDCGELDRALAVVLGMMVDSSVVDAERAPESMRESMPESMIASGDVAPPGPARAPWRFGLALSLQSELGRLPGVEAGLELGARVRPPGWPAFELVAAGWSEAGTEVMGGGSGSTFRHASAGLLVCPRAWQLEGAALEPCVGTQAGFLEAEGFGFLDNRERRELVLDLRGELRAELALSGPWLGRVSAGIWVPAVRPAFSYETSSGDLALLYQPEIAAGVVQLGVAARFP